MESTRANAKGDFLGAVEPIRTGVAGLDVWRWPCKSMEIGDWFTVAEADKPVGSVRAYMDTVQRRLGIWLGVTTDGETITVERLSDNPEERSQQRAERDAAKAVLVGGDGDKHLGVLQPPEQGMWSWPFDAGMEPGQFFHVSHTDRAPARVRTYAYNAMYARGMEPRVVLNDPELPGHCRIEYVDVAAKTAVHDLDYKGIDFVLKRCYGFDINTLGPWQCYERYNEPIEFRQVSSWDETKKQWVNPRPIKRIEKARLDSYVAVTPSGTYGMELEDDRIVVTALYKGTTHAAWRAGLDPNPFS